MSEDALLTGSSGLIGSEVSAFFHERGFAVHSIDDNQREIFFGPQGSTRWNQERLMRNLPRFTHHELDIRDRSGILGLVEQLKPTLIRSGSESNRAVVRRRGIKYVYGDIRSPSDLEVLPRCDWIIDAAANPCVLAGVDGKTSSWQLIEHAEKNPQWLESTLWLHKC